MRVIEKILIANRGEIARRVLRTVRDMGIATVAVYSEADLRAPHVGEADEAVCIGPAPSVESYLSIEAIIEAAKKVRADAVHPGYGFLAENAEFAAACEQAGLIFIGPSVACIRCMGSKIEAKRRMMEAGVPVIPGFAVEELSVEGLAEACSAIGYPVLIKASAGGGGRGMRMVNEGSELAAALESARREAANAFGDDTLLVERYFESSRHVEIQLFGDEHGNVIHCFERECSLQRRHQKIVEEAPSPAVNASLRERMGTAAVAAAQAIGYTGAGTVEFLLDDEGEFYFLEVNTRLQVEHPVTEAITGLDLVRMQVDVARGLPLPLAQEDLEIHGHAIEARLYAEDARAEFLPAAGRLALWEVPQMPGLRCDSGVERQSEIGVYYDPLLAKLIAHGADREESRLRLLRGLRELAVGGVVTNREFLISLLGDEAFVAGRTDTSFVDRHLPTFLCAPPIDPYVLRSAAVAAAISGHEKRRMQAAGPLPASIPSGWRNNRWRAQDVAFLDGPSRIEVGYVAESGECFAVTTVVDDDSQDHRVLLVSADADTIVLEIDRVRNRFCVADADQRVVVHSVLGTAVLEYVPRFPRAVGQDLAGGCVAPMTGVVRKVCVAEGDAVQQGELLLVLEAMKMEHQLLAHADGIVREIRTSEGKMVDPDDVLIVVESEE